MEVPMRIVTPVLLSLLFAGAASAANPSLKDWLKDLQARLQHTQKRYQPLTASASVRGDKKEDASRKLYWKGRKESRLVTLEEVNAFQAAVSLAEDGKTAESRAALNAFLAQYPSSPFKEDVQKTMALLPETPAAPPK
jgi:TolA-binding protein